MGNMNLMIWIMLCSCANKIILTLWLLDDSEVPSRIRPLKTETGRDVNFVVGADSVQSVNKRVINVFRWDRW